MNNKLDSYMVQYGLWGNCCNNCDFCLRKARVPISYKMQLGVLDFIKKNIDYIDWKGKFSAGISLLGGELYHITDVKIQNSFKELIQIIIDKILKVSTNEFCRISTVTNGLYEPSFLFSVMEMIKGQVGIHKLDLNISYDLKYRYKTEEDRIHVLELINEIHRRYDYRVGVQMILTQNLINLWKNGKFDVNEFIKNEINGNNLCFLYPHKIQTGKTLDDFFFNRHDFIEFMKYLRINSFETYRAFVLSCRNSSLFKYTGYRYRDSDDITQQPILCDDKELIDDICGHSILYQCYSDCNICMMCDLENLDVDNLL